MKWDYRTLVMNMSDPVTMVTNLREAGLDGWELVAIHPDSPGSLKNHVTAFLKRPKAN